MSNEDIVNLKSIIQSKEEKDECSILLSFNKNFMFTLDFYILEQLDLHIKFLKEENPSKTKLRLFLD